MKGHWNNQGAPPNMAADEDKPGIYEILYDAVVKSGAVITSPEVARVRKGELVNVVEVEIVESEARVRGRLEEPPGWISLLDLQSNYRWARSQKSKLIENILESDAQICQLLARTETLRMAAHARQQAYQARIGELQRKFLSAHVVPVRSDPKPQQRQPHHPEPLPQDAPSLYMERSMKASWNAALREKVDPTIPPGGRVVGYRFVEEAELDDRLRQQAAPPGEKAPPQPLSARERSVEYHIFGDQMLKPSKWHPRHPLIDRGFMQNVHPITHPQTNMTEYDFMGRPDLLRCPNFNAALDQALAAPRYTQHRQQWAPQYR